MSSVVERRGKRQIRLAELRAEREKILSVADPIRAERDALMAQYQPRAKALSDRLKEAQKNLYDIDMEIAEIVRLDGSSVYERKMAAIGRA